MAEVSEQGFESPAINSLFAPADNAQEVLDRITKILEDSNEYGAAGFVSARKAALNVMQGGVAGINGSSGSSGSKGLDDDNDDIKFALEMAEMSREQFEQKWNDFLRNNPEARAQWDRIEQTTNELEGMIGTRRGGELIRDHNDLVRTLALIDAGELEVPEGTRERLYSQLDTNYADIEQEVSGISDPVAQARARELLTQLQSQDHSLLESAARANPNLSGTAYRPVNAEGLTTSDESKLVNHTGAFNLAATAPAAQLAPALAPAVEYKIT